jgi:hypothetical protein
VLSEVSQTQKDKGYMFSLICGRKIQKINIYTKQARSHINSYVEHVCNSGTALWNSGKEGKEKKKINITSVKVENTILCIESC